MNHNLVEILITLLGTGSLITGLVMTYRANKKAKDEEAFAPTYTVEHYGVETLQMSFRIRAIDGLKMYGTTLTEDNFHVCINDEHFESIKRDYSIKLAKKMLEDGFVQVGVDQIGQYDKSITMRLKLLRPKNHVAA